MKIRPIGSNQTELTTDKATILFSYETPVAAYVNKGIFRTEKWYSVTTSKHIDKWLHGAKAEDMPQKFFDDLLRETSAGGGDIDDNT